MTRATRTYRYSLTANQVVILPNDGGYYKILEATGPISVSRDGNTLDGLTAGQGERENFKRLSIQDQSGAPNNIRIVIADASFVDDTIYGQVQVVDGGRLLTITDAAFVGSAAVAAAAGLYSITQLWNPGTNTKWASVSRVICSSQTANPAFQLRPSNAALTSLGNIPQPKKILTGASSCVMQTRFEQNAAILGGSVIGSVWETAQLAWPFDFKEPILLQPGQGLILVNAVLNASVQANFDFYEFTP